MPIMCAESCFLHIAVVNSDLVVSSFQVKLCEHRCVVQFIQKLIDDWDGKFIGHSKLVQGAIVYTEPPTTISLLNQQDRARIQTTTREDYS